LIYLSFSKKFEDKLIRNIKKGYKGNFGSLQTRFPDESISEVNNYNKVSHQVFEIFKTIIKLLKNSFICFYI
jgi:hypothetical protein